MIRSPVFDKWWPLSHSLDLVKAPVEVVAEAVQTDIARISEGERLVSDWVDFDSLDALFGSVSTFCNVSTIFFVLPTRSDWSVLWNNSFLCDGYDSLCSNLTRVDGLTTLAWSASDIDAVFQAGARFCHRRRQDGEIIERTVQAASNDGKWRFFEIGEPPLPEEELGRYAARRIADRMNETVLMELFERLGARPWQEDFYAVADQPCFRFERLAKPKHGIHRPAAQVVTGRAGVSP